MAAKRKTPKAEKRTLPEGKTVEDAGIPAPEVVAKTPEDERILLEPPPTPDTAEELEDVHADLKGALQLPKLSDEDLRRFVDDFTSDRIFTSAHLRERERDLMPIIFMPIAFGYFNRFQPDSLKQIGIIYEDMSKAGPRYINGRPIFTSLRVLHTDDWERARKAIIREEERRKNIEL